MIRLPPDSFNPPLTAQLLLSLIIVWAAIIVTLGWSASALISTQTNSRLGDQHGPSLSLLIQWVSTTGRSSVIRAPIVRVLGFPNADLPVRERGFRAAGEDLTHVCSVAEDRKDRTCAF